MAPLHHGSHASGSFSQANEKESKIDEDQQDFMDQQASEYWVVFTLLLGVLLRLFGIVKYDFKAKGFPSLGVTEVLPYIRSTSRAFYMLSTGIEPRICLLTAFCFHGSKSPVAAICRDICKHFVDQTDGDLDGIDMSELLVYIHESELEALSGLSENESFESGVPKTSSEWFSHRFTSSVEHIRGHISEAYRLSSPECVFNAMSRVFRCSCITDAFIKRNFPFSVPSMVSSESRPIEEVESVAALVIHFLRMASGKNDCDWCHQPFKISHIMRDKVHGFGSVMRLTPKAEAVVYTEGCLPTLTARKTGSGLDLSLSPSLFPYNPWVGNQRFSRFTPERRCSFEDGDDIFPGKHKLAQRFER